jgi:hypothetical protein
MSSALLKPRWQVFDPDLPLDGEEESFLEYRLPAAEGAAEGLLGYRLMHMPAIDPMIMLPRNTTD